MAMTASPAPNNPPTTGTPLLTASPVATAELAAEAPALVIVLATPPTRLVTTVSHAPRSARDIRRHPLKRTLAVRNSHLSTSTSLTAPHSSLNEPCHIIVSADVDLR
jgi:hypothetical protein